VEGSLGGTPSTEKVAMALRSSSTAAGPKSHAMMGSADSPLEEARMCVLLRLRWQPKAGPVCSNYWQKKKASTWGIAVPTSSCSP